MSKTAVITDAFKESQKIKNSCCENSGYTGHRMVNASTDFSLFCNVDIGKQVTKCMFGNNNNDNNKCFIYLYVFNLFVLSKPNTFDVN